MIMGSYNGPLPGRVVPIASSQKIFLSYRRRMLALMCVRSGSVTQSFAALEQAQSGRRALIDDRRATRGGR